MFSFEFVTRLTMNCANFYTDMMVCIELTKVLKNYVKHCSDYEADFWNIFQA